MELFSKKKGIPAQRGIQMRNDFSKLTIFLFLIVASMFFVSLFFVGEVIAGECGSYTTCMTEADGSKTCITVDKPCPPKKSTDTVHGSPGTDHTPPPKKENPPPKKKGSESTNK
jgi:hypothetical protein